MPIDLNTLIEHDMSDDCPVCRAQNLVDVVRWVNQAQFLIRLYEEDRKRELALPIKP